ncbi:MAG: chromosome segregation protein SMC [Wenzhouxiangella sp.]|nr:MAG: chromosome segregation protein SMC [Wenzhouxiangella sp.]
MMRRTSPGKAVLEQKQLTDASMRLTAIKLSGFKSFVEPTTVRFPSNLMAIVGPNGCGKSNIIDAVRWVMGESSARQLRGESMSDVIFSGSSARKPVATATVELLFDNSDGRAGGEYAAYGEISVKRQVSRDGQSAYFLNGTRCRRRDITDLFLGTGLGPRSYAIIEQGMISQIVEARPEELRGFLEEAAGVSRYKERRRETENRIRHTRENLERLRDLREEVGKQLEKLRRQARAAERYRKFKKRYREDEARLTALRWRETSALAEARQANLAKVETSLQAALSGQRSAEKELETLRQQQHEAGEQAASIQAELYEVAGEIARLEQAIEHQRDIRQRQKAEFAETETQLNDLQQHLILDKAQVSETSELIARLQPELEQARSAETQALAQAEQGEQAVGHWQQQWQEHQQSSAQAAAHAELLRQRIEHLDDRMGRAAERIRNLAAQGGAAAEEEVQGQLGRAREELEAAGHKLQTLRADGEQARTGGARLRDRIETLRNELEQARAGRHERSARCDSLRLLNRGGDGDQGLGEWLQARNIGPTRRVLSRIRVRDAHWTGAVEHVLADWLQAATVEQLEPLLDTELPDAGLSLVADAAVDPTPGTLAAQTEGAGVLARRLNRVRCAESLAEARALLADLGPLESVITPDGVWLGPGWMRQPAHLEGAAGVLRREAEIRELEQRLASDATTIERLESELKKGRAELHASEQEAQRLDQEMHQAERERAQVQGQISALNSRIETLARQREAVNRELETLKARQAEDTRAVGAARAELQEAMNAMEAAEQARDPLEQEKKRLAEVLDQARRVYREARERREAVSLKLESSRAGLDSLRQAIARIDNQVGQLQSRYVELSEALAQGDEPVRAQQTQRDALLERRLEVEGRLRRAREVLEELEAAWREQDERRRQSAAEAEAVRERQSALQLELHETQLKARSLAEHVEELEGDMDSLLETLPEGAQARQYQADLEQLEEKIRRLEPVNLAAIDEHVTESERKDYLDRQHEDLEQALDTLEKAISRIDRDSRTRFRETFEKVNQNMETLFPRLFGGGHGHLEMVGDDWLSAGVAIMARPPGKRIARIHMMSGGEKALTAVAFVFAIFNLNPAPFCLLDEVDAPLDDANVGRFSEMVREMSEQVQFLLVTHNKVTMEVAHQMLGVTMREPGVSRIVSVDLDRAVALADA